MSKVYIDISFESKDFIVEKLTNILKLEPTETDCIGEQLKNGVLLEYNVWSFSTEKFEILMLDEACDYFLEMFEATKDQLISFLRETKCNVSICFVLSEIEDDMPALSFTGEFIKYAGEIGANLSIDL